MSDYSKLTVVKLRDELKRRGLSQAGLKAVLVARLDEHDASQATTDAPQDIEPEQQDDDAPSAQEASGDDSALAQQVHPDTVVLPKDAPNSPVKANENEIQMPDATELQSNTVEEQQPEDLIPEAGEDHVEQKEEEGTQIDATKEPQDEKNEAPKVAAQEEMQDIPKEKVPSPSTPEPSVLHKEEEKFSKESQNVDMTDATDATKQTAAVTNAPITTTETQEDPAAPSRRYTEHTQYSTQTSVAPEEIQEDSKKRKRRSRSPVPLTQDVAMKRHKADGGSPRSQASIDVDAVYPMQTSDGEQEHPNASGTAVSPAKQLQGDARFKELFAPGPGAAPVEAQPSVPTEQRDVEPAVHPPTAALYIRNLMRPLHAPNLLEHLCELAEPYDGEQADMTKEFFLDAIKTHCLVQWADVNMAVRVREALHNKVWPDEKSRKALLVDYVPEDKLKTWIDVEKKAAGTRPPKRFEVVYENEDEKVVAYLQETDGGPKRLNTLDSRSGAQSAPSSAQAKPAEIAAPKSDQGTGFQALDDLFKSTSAKPKLYFQPVSDEIARQRLDRLSRGRGGGRGGDDMRRYTFEGKSTLVDNGPEFRPSYRGGGAMRGGRGGGFAPRGPRGGDSWRGGR